MNDPGLPTAATIVGALLHSPAPEDGTRADQEGAEILDTILDLHRNNAEQWDREDDARADNADDAMVAAAKRDIDRLNGVRHGFIEAIDRAMLPAINRCEGAPLVTESPGMAIDRLSVLVIRIASTEARAASDSADARLYRERLPRLRSQLKALEQAITALLNDVAEGTRRFVAYESLKLYGPEDGGQVG